MQTQLEGIKIDLVLLELFSGIGGFAKGFQEAGYSFKKHYFSEIDKYAIANYKYNFKNSEYVGSVTNVRGGEIERPNIITFGSPCQDFSLAGKRTGMEGQRSSLILEAIRLITETKPNVFIWENVKGAYSSNNGADFWAIIQAFTNIGGYRLEWQLLNTSWFLPQNRERIYLVGHLDEGSECGVFPFGEEFTRLNERSIRTSNITRCLTAGGKSGGYHSSMTLIKTLNNSETLNTIRTSGRGSLSKKHSWDILQVGTLRTHNDGKGFRKVNSAIAPTIPARAREDGSGQVVIRTRPHGYNKGNDLKICPTIKANSFEHNNCVVNIKPVLTPNRLNKRQNGRRFKNDGEDAFTLSCQDQHGVMINDTAIRRLTEIECERLQGFPDDWTRYGTFTDKNGIDEVKEIPKTQRYKMCGNAVTVNMPKEIAKRLKIYKIF